MAINMMAIRGPQVAGPLDFRPVGEALQYGQQVRQANAMMERQAAADKRADAALDLQRQGLELRKQAAARGPARPWWAGPQGQVDPAMLRYRQAGRPVTTVNVGAQEKAYDKAAGKGLYDEFKGYQTSAAGAQKALQQLKVMDTALSDPNLYTGTGGQSVQYLKQAARTLFGVKVQGVESGEIVNNIAKKIALGMKGDLPGPLSNSDREFLVEMAPGLTRSRAGNMAIVKFGIAQRQYEVDVSRAAMEYASRNGGRLDVGWYQAKSQIDQQYSQRFAGLMDEIKQAASTIQQPSPTAGVPPELLRSDAWRRLAPGTTVYGPDGQAYTKE